MYSLLPNQNQHLKEYVGETWTQKLLIDATNSLFEIANKKCDIIGDIRKKAIVACIDPSSMIIESLGGSQLLYDKTKNKVVENLILDNFGLIFASLFRATSVNSLSITTKNDDGTSRNFFTYGGSGTFNSVNPTALGTQVRMGSSLVVPARGDFQIGTALANAPESGYLDTNTGGYTSQNAIIYQGDANPTGGAGTVTEIITAGAWNDGTNNVRKTVIAHDQISAIPYTAGKLLRGSYLWQI